MGGVVITFFRHGYGEKYCPSNNTPAHRPCRECANVYSKYIKSLICSTSGHEYFKGGYGAYKYAHLDFDVFDVDLRPESTSQYGGVLSEIWGLVPMSNSSRDISNLRSASSRTSQGKQKLAPTAELGNARSPQSPSDNCDKLNS